MHLDTVITRSVYVQFEAKACYELQVEEIVGLQSVATLLTGNSVAQMSVCHHKIPMATRMSIRGPSSEEESVELG